MNRMADSEAVHQAEDSWEKANHRVNTLDRALRDAVRVLETAWTELVRIRERDALSDPTETHPRDTTKR